MNIFKNTHKSYIIILLLTFSFHLNAADRNKEKTSLVYLKDTFAYPAGTADDKKQSNWNCFYAQNAENKNLDAALKLVLELDLNYDLEEINIADKKNIAAEFTYYNNKIIQLKKDFFHHHPNLQLYSEENKIAYDASRYNYADFTNELSLSILGVSLFKKHHTKQVRMSLQELLRVADYDKRYLHHTAFMDLFIRSVHFKNAECYPIYFFSRSLKMQSPNIDENDEEYKAAIVNAINTLERYCVYNSINYIKNENGLCINLVKMGNNEDSDNNRYHTINALFQNIFAISSKTFSDNKTKAYILYKKKSARVAAEVQARKKQIAAVKENTEILETKINTDKDPYLYSDIVPVEVIIENMKRFSGNDLTKNIRPLIKYVTEFNNEFQLSEILQKRQPESLSQYYLQKIIHKKDLFSKHHFFGKLNLSGSNIDSIINKNNYNYAGFSDDFSLLFLSLCCCEEFALVREPLFKLINSPEELLRQHLTKNMDIFLKNVHLDESGVPAFIPYDFFKDLFGKTNLILDDFAESILSKAVGYLTAWCNQSSVDFTKDGYIALNKIVVKPDLLETFYSEAFKIWDATTNDVEVKSQPLPLNFFKFQ